MSSSARVVEAMKAAEIHCARSCPIWKYRLMSGTATFTMVEDMIEAIIPTMTVSSTSHRKRGPWRSRSCSIVVGAEACMQAQVWARRQAIGGRTREPSA